MKKININSANENELKKLPGIGTSAAKKILAFRKSGGTFNSVEEVTKVANVRSSYVEGLKANLGFERGELVPSQPRSTQPGRVDMAIPIDPRKPLLQFPLPVFNSYSFTVKLKGSDGANLPDLQGYKLIVGYRLGTYKGFDKTKYTSKSLTYNLGSQSSQKVNISKPLLGSSFIEDTFNLLIVSPGGRNIYDSSFEIDEDATVEIGLPVFNERQLKVKLTKRPQINYAGYQLVVVSKINRSSSGIETQTEKFEIASANSFLVEYDPFGDVLEVNFEVLSPDGAIIFSESMDWDDLAGNANSKNNEIKLPSPTNIGYTIKLVIDPDQLNNPYLDHEVVVKYELIDPETLNHINQIEKSFPIAADGKAKVSIDYYGLIERMEIDVKAPSGEIIGHREIELPLNNNNNIEIKVPPKDLAGIEGFESLPLRPKKTTGRVIDLKGDRTFENVQVIIHVATKDAPQDDDFTPLMIVNTEKEGYFIFDTPNSYFTEVFASIGIPKKGNVEGKVINVPIRLETDKVTNMTPDGPVLVDKLFLPPHVILVVDMDSITEEDAECDCNDCGDLDFHRPKKVVDEFSYYTVVRTTEPTIQGYTLDDDGEMTIQEILNVVQLADEPGSSTKNIPVSIQNQAIRKNVLMKHINDKRGLTLTTLTRALNESNALKLRENIKPRQEIRAFGRHKLDLNHAIDWDEDPTIYQATTISHGHLLHFKQEWVNDGYGMGDLLYSLPLAPGQKKQIVVYDWERRESAAQVQSLDYQESLYNSLSRDRDINEIVTGSLSEQTRGGSTARTSSIAGGFGIGAILGPVGALLGVAGGSSKASSSAWQNSSRNTALNDLQQLRDRTVQSANAVRSQRSTVVATATQGERFSVETEVVANYNHCHSLTIQYFEVLRHMQIQQRLSNVQECLFIPLILDTFDHQKSLRWREYIQRFIRGRKLRKGFDAIERIENDYEGSDLPEGTYAQENIEYLEGGIYIKFDLASPIDLEFVEDKEAIITAFQSLYWIIPGLARHIDRIFDTEAKKRNEVFTEYVAPEIAAAFVENLKFEAVIESSLDGTESTELLPVDTTLITRFNNGRSHYVTLRQHSDFDGISRESIKAINITKARDVVLSNGESLADAIPVNSKIIITSGRLNYRTAYSSGRLFSKSRILDDLLGYGGVADEGERVRIATPLSRQELRNPRNEDLELANKLQDHLNDNLESYHKVIWMSMSSERRFMFLDGIQVTDYSNIEQYPGGIIRSVASVVENRVIGIVGNSLVMPVAPGFRLDPNTRGKDVDLLSLYQPISPIEPVNVSIPTKGVFAEAVMGKCNSCEVKEEDRFWRWEESPIPDSPTAIGQVSTDSRRSDPLDTTVNDLPTPVVNIQNAPAAPDPTGLAAAQALLGTSSFTDITGLEQNQKNALEALKASLSTAQAFGTKAGDMAALGAQLDAIKTAKEIKLLEDDKAKEMTEKAINTFNKKEDTGGKETNIPEAVKSGSKAIKEGASKVKVKENKNDGSSTEVEIESTPEEAKPEATYDSLREDYDTIAKESKNNF
ncbi:MAG: helix-hairpin-helix domain-containing protein [Flavobacteriaceae bacterium]|nr:helix-hairpin-helix domain-containing protein [Flavobacteriaceae bacterium]